MSKKDNVTPSDSWEFNEQVADCFDNMLERSIPQYNVMRDTVSKLTHSILSKSHKYSHNILDIGCSDGLMIQSLLVAYKYGKAIEDCLLGRTPKRELSIKYSKKLF